MKSYKNITEYIKDVPKEHQEYVKTMRELVKKIVPKGEEVIRYGMPTMQIGGKNLIHYAAMKGHFGFYPAPSGIIAFKSELDKACIEYSKGCIRFPYNEPLPVSLITKIIKFRVKEEKSR
ncbi:MAG: DUF1801 domain-containing protein [Candidatus Pacebacteria bacterium]|nr:DUF1801 domain-containing protein [Candidatus Paceibacterota bacterium]